jgi:hypothetical protein
MYSRLYSGLTLYSGNSGEIAHLGQSYLSYATKPLGNFGSFGITWANFTTTHLYREDTLALTYARYLDDVFPSLEKSVSLGVNVKYLRRGYSLDAATANDAVFASGNRAAGVAADVGLLFKPEEGALAGWRLGVAGKNLNQPDLGLQETELLPIEWRLGLAYRSRKVPWLVPALDVTRRNRVNGLFGGVESWLFRDALGVRVGGNKEEATAGLSYYQAFGAKLGFRLDYGFAVPFYVEGSNGSHRLAMSVYF